MGSVLEHNTHGPINWFSQFSPYRRSFRLTGGGSTDGVSSPFFIFYQSIITFVIVNWLSLNFLQWNTFVVHCLTTLPQLQRTSTPKTKNRHFLVWRLILFRSWPNLSLYNITANTFTICKCIPAFNMCILYSHYVNIYHSIYKTLLFFAKIFHNFIQTI